MAVTVHKNHTVRLNEQQVKLGSLVEHLRRALPGQRSAIYGDRKADLSLVVNSGALPARPALKKCM